MNKAKILEIARRYTVPKEESSLLVEFNGDDVPTPTGETLNLMMWSFCEEELLAFSNSVIEADRESSDEPVAWLTLGKDMGSDRDIVTFSKSPLIPSIPLYTRPTPARKPLSDEVIEEIHKEFPSRIDLFVRAIEKMHGIGETE